MREHSRREAHEREIEPQQVAAEETKQQEQQFVGGKPPPVTDVVDQKHAGATASERAYAEDDHERELKTKVSALVANKFGGDYKKAFAHYDTDGDGAISKGELSDLLSDAGVGSGLTRGIWASKIIEKLDTSADKKIEWSEFEAVFTARA